MLILLIKVWTKKIIGAKSRGSYGGKNRCWRKLKFCVRIVPVLGKKFKETFEASKSWERRFNKTDEQKKSLERQLNAVLEQSQYWEKKYNDNF